MKYRLHFEWPEGTKDFIDIEADTLEEIKRIACNEISSRNGKNEWSEELNGN